MSTILNEFPRQRGRPRVYPWDEWMDGQARELIQNEDFFSQAKSFRVLVHRTAKDNGLKAETSISPDETAITIIFFGHDDV